MDRLPEGYDTKVGERGLKLSGGGGRKRDRVFISNYSILFYHILFYLSYSILSIIF